MAPLQGGCAGRALSLARGPPPGSGDLAAAALQASIGFTSRAAIEHIVKTRETVLVRTLAANAGAPAAAPAASDAPADTRA